MRKIKSVLTLLMVVGMMMGLAVTANAAAGTGTSNYYYNLEKNMSTALSGTVFLTSENEGISDANYLSYTWPEKLKAKVTVTPHDSGHYCDDSTKCIEVAVVTAANGFDDCDGGCLTFKSGNQWEYNCWGSAAQNVVVYAYKCQSGSFTAEDVTFIFDADGTLTGATVKGTGGTFTVPESMIQITDNAVDPAQNDYTRTAKLGGVIAKVVDGMLAWEGNGLDELVLSPQQQDAVKAALKAAESDDAVKQIVADTKALAEKSAARKVDIDTEATLAKEKVDAIANLSDEDKAALKAQIDAVAAAAKADVDQQDTVAKVETVYENAKSAMDAVVGKGNALVELAKHAAECTEGSGRSGA